MYTTITNCARCGETHEDLKFAQFTRPVADSDGTLWDYWVLCPATKEPILMKAEWELSGIDEQVKTGHIDADTSKPCGPLESIT